MRALIATMFAMALSFATAHAATDKPDPGKTGGAGKGAAVGALAGHEMGSGHAATGAATGAIIGHHDKKKAEERSDRKD